MKFTTSIYKNSQQTKSLVLKQILDKYGTNEARKYDPLTNCFTFNGWKERGYQVKKGEKALKSSIFIKYTDKDGNTKAGYKNINVFYYLQVEKIGEEVKKFETCELCGKYYSNLYDKCPECNQDDELVAVNHLEMETKGEQLVFL